MKNRYDANLDENDSKRKYTDKDYEKRYTSNKEKGTHNFQQENSQQENDAKSYHLHRVDTEGKHSNSIRSHREHSDDNRNRKSYRHYEDKYFAERNTGQTSLHPQKQVNPKRPPKRTYHQQEDVEPILSRIENAVTQERQSKQIILDSLADCYKELTSKNISINAAAKLIKLLGLSEVNLIYDKNDSTDNKIKKIIKKYAKYVYKTIQMHCDDETPFKKWNSPNHLQIQIHIMAYLLYNIGETHHLSSYKISIKSLEYILKQMLSFSNDYIKLPQMKKIVKTNGELFDLNKLIMLGLFGVGKYISQSELASSDIFDATIFNELLSIFILNKEINNNKVSTEEIKKIICAIGRIALKKFVSDNSLDLEIICRLFDISLNMLHQTQQDKIVNERNVIISINIVSDIANLKKLKGLIHADVLNNILTEMRSSQIELLKIVELIFVLSVFSKNYHLVAGIDAERIASLLKRNDLFSLTPYQVGMILCSLSILQARNNLTGKINADCINLIIENFNMLNANKREITSIHNSLNTLIKANKINGIINPTYISRISQQAENANATPFNDDENMFNYPAIFDFNETSNHLLISNNDEIPISQTIIKTPSSSNVTFIDNINPSNPIASNSATNNSSEMNTDTISAINIDIIEKTKQPDSGLSILEKDKQDNLGKENFSKSNKLTLYYHPENYKPMLKLKVPARQIRIRFPDDIEKNRKSNNIYSETTVKLRIKNESERLANANSESDLTKEHSHALNRYKK